MRAGAGRTPGLFPSDMPMGGGTGKAQRGSGVTQGGSCRCEVSRADTDKKDPEEGRRGRGHLGICPRGGKISAKPEGGRGLALRSQ